MEQAALHLSKLISCETINDPNQDEATRLKKFQNIEGVMQTLYPRVFEALERIPIQDNLLLRWKGQDSQKPAVILMAHLDVVPATGAWSVPPFEGVIKDGCVWGRGAMDTKNSLCAMYEAMENLLKKGFTPPCDVYLSSSYNEETMGPGARNARDYFKENNIPLRLVFDEGGAVVEKPMPGLNGRFAMIGVTEKGYANVRFTAGGKGGHASAPPKDSPVARLAAFVTHIEKHPPFAVRFSPVVKDMFKAIAPHMAQPYRFLFSNLWLFGGLIKRVMPKVSPQAAAMLKTTCAFTMMAGSEAANVMPETASVTANLRFISHQRMEESLDIITKEAAKFDLKTELLYGNDVSPETSRDEPMYGYVKSLSERIFEDAPVAPYLMVGGTDSRHFSALCPATIRFSPTVLTPKQLASMHALDEHSGIDALLKSITFYEALVEGL